LIRFGVSREHRVWLFKALRQFGKRLAKLGPGWVAEIGAQVGAYLTIATAQIGATGSVRLIRKLDLSFDASGFQASACGGGSPIVDVTYRFRNSVDTASLDRAHPRYWAYDSGAARYRVWKVGDERFCQISDLTGTFTAVSGSSPNGSGSISAGITGSFRGGTRATFSGTFDPGIATSGDLGTFDSSCEISDDRAAATCDGDGGFATDFFPERRDWTPVWEVWLYNGGAHGTWLQTTAGNAGDILG
jgi:hypothetical protein